MSAILNFFKPSKGKAATNQNKPSDRTKLEEKTHLPNEKKAEKILSDFDMEVKYGPKTGKRIMYTFSLI